MGYTLVPILIDLPRLQSLMGSKDVKLLQAVIKKYRRDMLDTDAGDDFFEEFENEIKAEYKAFVAGDFSGVDLNRSYPDDEEKEGDGPEDDESLAELLEGVGKLDPDAPGAEKRSLVLLRRYFRRDEGDECAEDEEDDVEPVKELTTGAALAHLLLGGKPDKSQGHKYGYALCNLCAYLGKIPNGDSWCSLRGASGAVERVDAVLKNAGVDPEVFSVSGFLIERGAPVAMPEPHGFPNIGYLTRQESRRVLGLLDPAKTEAAIRGETTDYQVWLRDAVGELRAWLRACVKADRDLICFYC